MHWKLLTPSVLVVLVVSAIGFPVGSVAALGGTGIGTAAPGSGAFLAGTASLQAHTSFVDLKSTAVTSPPFSSLSGDTILVGFSILGTGTVKSVKDSANDRFVQLNYTLQRTSVGGNGLALWAAYNAAGGAATTLSVLTAGSGTPDAVVEVMDVSGVATQPLDFLSAPTSSAASKSFDNPVRAGPGDFLVSFLAARYQVSVHATGAASVVNVLSSRLTSPYQTGADLDIAGGAARVAWVNGTLSSSHPWLQESLSLKPAASSCSSSAFLAAFCAHINHVVVVFMENHAYDNYFASYCFTPSRYCNGTANHFPIGNAQQQFTPNGCVVQRNFTARVSPSAPWYCPAPGEIRLWNLTMANVTTSTDLQHDWQSTPAAIDNPTSPCTLRNNLTLCGTMDGFWSAEGKYTKWLHPSYTFSPFGVYNGSTLPVYWDMAQQFALGDYVFSSALAYSLPNHWYMVAGQAPASSWVGEPSGTSVGKVTHLHNYLNQSNGTTTVQDLFNVTPGVSWKYYDSTLGAYQSAIQPGGGAYNAWQPFAARAESYSKWYDAHFANRNQIFKDLTQPPSFNSAGVQTNGLPNVSWVIPQTAYSDHPPANLSLGEAFVENVTNAVEMSPYWNSTMIVVCWDDYGGYYDQVIPPHVDSQGLAIRVPFLVLSPYTPRGTIDNGLGDFESVLHLIEVRWHLRNLNASSPFYGQDCIDARDCGAPMGLWPGFFNFTMTPRLTPAHGLCLFYPPGPAVYPMQGCEPASQVQFDPSLWVGSNAGEALLQGD